VRRGAGFVPVLLLPLLLVVSGGLRRWLDREWLSTTPAAAEVTVSAEVVRRLASGFHPILADWYWIRTLTYFGEQARRQEVLDVRGMPQLAELLQLTVTLDPQHLTAWRFGGFFLSQADLEAGRSFLREGMRENPLEWRLRADLAFLSWRAGRYREAALAWRQAAALPGAPAWIEPMIAITLGQGGERETARTILQRLRESTDDPFVREVCRWQLEQLDRSDQDGHDRDRQSDPRL
jgi:hypothetical protein